MTFAIDPIAALLRPGSLASRQFRIVVESRIRASSDVIKAAFKARGKIPVSVFGGKEKNND